MKVRSEDWVWLYLNRLRGYWATLNVSWRWFFLNKHQNCYLSEHILGLDEYVTVWVECQKLENGLSGRRTPDSVSMDRHEKNNLCLFSTHLMFAASLLLFFFSFLFLRGEGCCNGVASSHTMSLKKGLDLYGFLLEKCIAWSSITSVIIPCAWAWWHGAM